MLENFLRYLRAKVAMRYIPKGSIVCDIGCGDGYLLRKLANMRCGYGFDWNAPCANSARLKIQRLDLNKRPLPLKEGTTDIVTILAVLEHLENPEKILKEAYRILKPKGTLIITTPSTKAQWILELLAFFYLLPRDQIKEHKRYYTPRMLYNLLPTKSVKIKTFQFGFNILAVAKK